MQFGLVYITGLAVHRVSAAYRGQGKTDARDAFVIADQVRMRTDLGVLRPGEEIAVDLRTQTARRTDLVNDRTRAITLRVPITYATCWYSCRRPAARSCLRMRRVSRSMTLSGRGRSGAAWPRARCGRCWL